MIKDIKEKEKSCGVILVLRRNGEDRFLILQQNGGHWSFPKGHSEKKETAIQSAVRELSEEAGISDIEFAKLPSITDRYIFEKRGKKFNKTVELFIAFAKNDKVTIQQSEIKNFKWATFKEAIETFTYDETKKVLEIAQKYLKDMVK